MNYMSSEQEPCEPRKMDLVAKNASTSTINPINYPNNADPTTKDSTNLSHDSQCAPSEHIDPISKTNTTSSGQKPCESKKKRPSYEEWFQLRYSFTTVARSKDDY